MSSPEIISEETSSQEDDLEKDRFEPYVKLPKWLRIILMIIPASIIAAIIITVDKTIGFPETIFPTAIMALIGMAIFGIVVIGDMVYRNVFVYKMLRYESRKSRVFKQIIKERKEASEKSRYEYEQSDEYEYDDEDFDKDELESEDDIEEEEYDDDEIHKDEYTYDLEEGRQQYKMKSFILRGGIITILTINGILLVVLAAIFQIALYGGFGATT
ncbi:MAG: hypothetical protein FK731_04580 [Asgard group archaeon]|nr:hypothetical protein [Asgard group archaeon]